jgi:hypothetical protein
VSRRDHFSYGVVIYAACFFLIYKTFFQMAYIDKYAVLWNWACGLIVLHVLGLIWCVFACILLLMPRQLLSFLCAATLVIGMQLLSPDPIWLHFKLHEDEYRSLVSKLPPSQDGHVSTVLYSYSTYIPSMPGGYLCPTEIIYDDSQDIARISNSSSGRARVERLDGNFYLRYAPCG